MVTMVVAILWRNYRIILVIDLVIGKAMSEIDLDSILEDLDSAGKKLPVAAIREARKHREIIIPRLIEVLRKTAAEARAGNLPEGDIHFFALFLLTEFQAKEALPAILDVFSLPGELPFDLFGDTVTETLVRILADFASDQPDILDKLIEKREVTEFVRAAAAETFLYLVRDGHMSREDAITRLQRHLREAMKSHDERIIGFLIAELYSYAPKEAWGDIEEAYRRNLVDRFIVNEENIKQSISEGESHFQKSLHNCRRTGIKDIIA